MTQIAQEEKSTIFQASLHVFIPLKHIKKDWKADFIKGSSQVDLDPRIRNTEAELWYWELKGKEQDFSYRYCIVHEESKEKEIIIRQVTLRLFLVKFISEQLNPDGRYYLVIGTGIDKNFTDGTPCSDKDLIYLKKAFYERREAGLYSGIVSVTYFYEWLSTLVKQIGGYNPDGHFNRHYVLNIKAAQDDFDKDYYGGEAKPYEEVIVEADRLAYALLYGNDNVEVVPEKTIQDTFKDSFTNNFTQKMFAGNKTIVFFKTHSDTVNRCEKNVEPPFDANFGTALNVFDICFVMEAKFKLKSIQRLMRGFHPFRTRKVLASISVYLNINPFHLAEIKKRTDYLYEALGVNALLQTVKEQGSLLSESSTAQLAHKLDLRVLLLTILMTILAGLQLIVSILCCNICDYNSKTISDMCNCIPESAGCIGSCCAVVSVLLGFVLAASIIVMAVYQVMSFYKLRNIERELRSLNK